MKNRLFYTLIAMLLCVATVKATPSMVVNGVPTKEEVAKMSAAEKEARGNAIKLRVEEIKNMDKSTLSKTERKALKKELRELRKEAKAIGGGGVYISLAGILIIILVLILVL